MTVAVWLVAKTLASLRLQERHERLLVDAQPEISFRFCRTKEQFLAALPEAEVAVCWSFQQEWLALAPRLRRIISPTAGNEWFPIELRPGLNLEFSRFHGRIMAETVLGMMLCHARGLFRSYRLQAVQPWPREELEPGLRTLRGARLTIVGFGRIGLHVGRLAKGFGMRILGLKPTPGQVPEYFEPEDRLLPASELDNVLPITEHLVLCLPATPETDGIMSARRLELLPLHAGLYNIGRGNAVNEEELAAWLRSRPLAGAYLDVFREEPLVADSPLRRLPNCLILPHLSAIAPDFLDLFVEELIERLRRS